MGEHDPFLEEKISTDTRDEVTEPPLYRVILINDDYTTMEFVVEVLVVVFNKAVSTATQIMLDVHKRGSGLCGTYPREIAETKVDTVHTLAREKGFPLKCVMEKA
jgi:ATP-dependent Clp protease adaptor protein ClpS